MSDSFYLQRLKACMNNGRYQLAGSSQNTRWFGRKHLAHFARVTLESITYYEEEYKGEQIIIVGLHYILETLLNQNGEPFIHSPNDDEIAGYEEPEKRSTYDAYSWEIGSDYDKVVDLAWMTALTATLSGTCESPNQDKTLRSARKKIDLSAKIRSVKDELLAITGDRINYEISRNPYNAVVNDFVYIQAFGRLRRGKIVATTGSRFIVGYATPSNSRELKYKTLPLSQLWIDTISVGKTI